MKENFSFEDTIEKLEKIVNELENEELSLEESIKKFEEGIKLSKASSEMLDNAEKRISILIEDDGQIKEEKFED